MGVVYEHEGFDRNTHLRPLLEFQVGLGISQAGTLQQGGTVTAHLPTIPSINNTASGDNVGLYLQDTYKPLPNLTLGLGVRVDLEDLNSFGHTYFDPRQERDTFNGLLALTGVETSDDLDYNGVLDKGLEASDPLFEFPEKSQEVKALNSELRSLAVRRFTRHEFDVQIQSAYLSSVLGHAPEFSDLFDLRINPRRPDQIHIQNTNVAPRLSLTWDPWADGKSK